MKEQTSEQASFYHLEAFDGLAAFYALCALL